MEHLSEVLKILDGALRANASMAASYAGLLADKLEGAGDRTQARLIRDRLARAPQALVAAQDGARGVSFSNLPVDGESKLHTVDVSRPEQQDLQLVLPTALRARLDDFLAGVRHHDELVRAGAALPNRLLVYGAPGTGKTQLARWAAAQLDLPLLTVRCDTLVSSLLGQTSRNLRRVFEYAQQAPCALFLDEFDALAGARGNDRDVGELQRVVIALLQNIDALPSSAILIAATNHEQLLDPAVWRRFSFRLAMPLPALEARRQMWANFLLGMAPSDAELDELAQASDGASGALIEQVCLDAKRDAVLGRHQVVSADTAFRRLGLAIAIAQGQRLNSLEDEIRWLRAWYPTRFTLRTLAQQYGISTRQITNTIREKIDGHQQAEPSKKRSSST